MSLRLYVTFISYEISVQVKNTLNAEYTKKYIILYIECIGLISKDEYNAYMITKPKIITYTAI